MRETERKFSSAKRNTFVCVERSLSRNTLSDTRSLTRNLSRRLHTGARARIFAERVTCFLNCSSKCARSLVNYSFRLYSCKRSNRKYTPSVDNLNTSRIFFFFKQIFILSEIWFDTDSMTYEDRDFIEYSENFFLHLKS